MDFSPINFKEELNSEQFAAVTAPDGPALVLAGAGSGKTRTLTYRVAYLILEKKIHPNSLLLLTFTNKAAKEMVTRVQSLTGLHYPPQWSGTFHSVGGRLLRQYGHHLGLTPKYTILDQSDSESLLTRIIKEQDKTFSTNKDNPKPKVIHSLISYARNTSTSLEDQVNDRFPWEEHLAEKIFNFADLYHKTKLEEQVVDYDDLLVYWLRLLKEFPEVRQQCEQRFPYILVDEYQDTNTLQAAIIDEIGKHHNIMAVGDDAQCIYTWRGANFDNISTFGDRHPRTMIYKILTNYRSSPEILDYANSVLAAQPLGSGYRKELLPHKPSKGQPYVVPVIDTRRQAQFLVTRIEALYEEGYALKDIAILYRAHYQALDTQLEFTRRGIPFVITSGIRFFEQAHIKDFVAQLRILNNPTDSAAFNRLLGLLPRVGPTTVNKILNAANKELDKLKKAYKCGKTLFGENKGEPSLFDALTLETIQKKVPKDAREDYKQLTSTLVEIYPLLLESEDNKETIPATIVQRTLDGWYGDYIRNVYPDWENREDDLQGLIDFASRYETMAEFLAQVVLMTSETGDKSIEVDDSSVRMTTIHQAKGLEFPIVFVIGCAEDMLPLKRAVESGDIEEERRLFYVAVTRAMDELYLTVPLVSSGRGTSLRMSPSRFLQEVPKDRYEKLHYNPSW